MSKRNFLLGTPKNKLLFIKEPHQCAPELINHENLQPLHCTGAEISALTLPVLTVWFSMRLRLPTASLVIISERFLPRARSPTSIHTHTHTNHTTPKPMLWFNQSRLQWCQAFSLFPIVPAPFHSPSLPGPPVAEVSCRVCAAALELQSEHPSPIQQHPPGGLQHYQRPQLKWKKRLSAGTAHWSSDFHTGAEEMHIWLAQIDPHHFMLWWCLQAPEMLCGGAAAGWLQWTFWRAEVMQA